MSAFRSTLVASALAGALALGSAPAAAQYDAFVFFGDSLTDAGSYKPLLPPGVGLFTTNPGPVWAQLLGSEYGFVIVPANQGGTDYAYGGARVVLTPGYPPAPPTSAAVPIATQIQQAIGKGIDPNAVYFVWGGANDVFTDLAALQAGQMTQAQLQADVGLVATQLAQRVALLSNAGARYVVVLNLPDIGRTPAFASSSQSASVSAISALFNSTFIAALDAANVPTMRVNIAGLFAEVIANPAQYGFANVSAPACGATPALVCTAANFVAPNAQNTFLFADGVHPTTAGHRLIEQLVNSMLTAPAQIAALGEAPLNVQEALSHTIDARIWSQPDSSKPSGKFNAWASYDYSNIDSGNHDLNTVVIGGDMRLGDRVLVGVAFGYSEDKGDFGSGGGGFKLRETSGTVYANYDAGRWSVGGSVMGGDLDFRDVHRTFDLGIASRTESGRATGSHWAAEANGAYWFGAQGALQNGPYAQVTYQEASVNAFSEVGSSSTALSYDKQKRESLQTSLGWQAKGQVGMFRPFARVAWEFEAKDDERAITAHSVTLGGRYQVAPWKPDDNWARFTLGASADFGKLTGFVVGSGTASKGDGNEYAVTIGVRVPL